jgi:PKD repeat protein
LSVLQFDGRRSDAWTREQATPGGSEAPTITLTPNPRADLRVSADVARFFRITHPVTKSVTLTVSGPGVGTLYNGPWSIATDVLVPPSLPYTFTRVGRQSLTVTARYGTASASATLSVDVVNSPPNLALRFTGDPRQGEPFAMTAQITDINEADPSRLCANTTWAVDAPDTLSATSGCQVTVSFGTTGPRTVRVSTRDTEGLSTSATRTLTVLPPPENPYPRITAYGMYSRDSLFFDGQFLGCDDRAVAGGATIDFREKGCRVSVALPERPRFFAGVTVENPDAEALTYDWRLFVRRLDGSDFLLNSVLGSPNETFEPYSVGNTIPVTDPCYVTVRVNAPEASRSKDQLVWSGQCTYYSTRIN